MNTYYHNPRCSKSRQGLVILEENKTPFTIREYLKEKLNKQELTELFEKLKMEPIKAIRTKENIFKELGLKDKTLSQKEWIDLIIVNPILLERPILVTANNSIIGRPPENFNNI